MFTIPPLKVEKCNAVNPSFVCLFKYFLNSLFYVPSGWFEISCFLDFRAFSW